MKPILMLAVLLAFAENAWSYKINPDYYGQEDLFIYRDNTFLVPECRKVLLQDINHLGEKTWLEIEGIVQVSESFSFSASPSHYFNGKFTYSTNSGLPKQKVVVYSGAKITLRSENAEARTPIELFLWSDCPKRQNP